MEPRKRRPDGRMPLPICKLSPLPPPNAFLIRPMSTVASTAMGLDMISWNGYERLNFVGTLGRPGAKPIKSKPYVNRRHKIWTTQEVDKLRKYLSDGMRPKAIAALLKRSCPSVASKMWRLKEDNTREAAYGNGGSQPTASAS